MKYRMLSREEMELFDEEFKYFLIANGVTNEEWLSMNKNDHDGATKLVELFSDAVLETVYTKVKYMEFREKSSCLVFYLGEDSIELISLNSKSTSVDLSTPEKIHDAILNQTKFLEIFKANKKYTLPREEEIHKMTQDGCVNSTKEFWDALDAVLSVKD